MSGVWNIEKIYNIMMEIKKIDNYSEPAEKALELIKKIDDLKLQMHDVQVEIEGLKVLKAEVLDDPRIKSGAKPLPSNWDKINSLLRESINEYNKLAGEANVLIAEQNELAAEHKLQRQILEYLNEDIESKN